MNISVWVLMALCYGGFYVHDRVVLETVTNEEMAAWLSRPDSEEDKVWCGKIRETLDGKMLLFQIRRVKVRPALLNKKAEVHYTVPLTWKFLKKALTGNKKEQVYETVREEIVPAKYMWDIEIEGRK